MYSKVISCGVLGIQGVMLYVEADVRDGLPTVSMVGSLSASVRESKDRVITAIQNIGIKIPPKKVTISLLPADFRKEGSLYDLPIAVALLASYGYIPSEELENVCFLGEISLNGEIKPVKGILPMVSHMKEKSIRRCFVPKENEKEARIIDGIEICPVETLNQVLYVLQNHSQLDTKELRDDMVEHIKGTQNTSEILDFSDIIGQEFAKRGAEIAVAGRHNLLLLGAPGTGKSMIASRLPSIMPKLTKEESLEITKIYSVKGELKDGHYLIEERPFRAPHHTITDVALVGGGRFPVPGEISMAHKGVLFLDEFPEFSRNALEVLRQPLEEKRVVINRMYGTYIYPSDILLLGAMNPCPCGYYPNRKKCRCSEPQIRNYLGRISGPLLERMDLMAEVSEISYEQLESSKKTESSEDIRKRVEQAVFIQSERYRELEITFNSQLHGKWIEKFCPLDKNSQQTLQYVFEKRNWSPRTYYRTLKVARTIADLEQEEKIREEHIIEAIAYRGMEQKYWR